MKYLLIALTLLLTGCETFKQPVPVSQKFPEPYSIGVKKEQPKCPELQIQTGDSVPITELLKTVVNNYTLYYKCSDYVEGWNKWYKEQKQIYEKVSK